MSDKNTDERLARSEIRIDNLEQKIDKVDNDVSDLSEDVKEGFAKILENQSKRNRTDWPTLASWIGIIILIGGLIGAIYVRDYSRLESAINKNANILYQQPKMEERVSHLEKAQLELDEVLHREMELIRQQLHTEIESNKI